MEIGNSKTDFKINGKCSGCGSCCSDLLPLSKKDISMIKQFLKNHPIRYSAETATYTAGARFSCPFRSEAEHKCMIYSVRPEICRDFLCGNDPLKGSLDMSVEREIVSMRNLFFGGKKTPLEILTEIMFESILEETNNSKNPKK